MQLPTPLGDKGIVPTPYLIIIHTKVKRGREIRRGATPNSFPIQHLPQQGRSSFPGVFSHVTMKFFQGPWKRGVWKGRDVQGDTSLALSRRSFQRPPGEDAASAERAAGARPQSCEIQVVSEPLGLRPLETAASSRGLFLEHPRELQLVP